MSKIYKVKWTSNAKEDLLNIVDYNEIKNKIYSNFEKY